MTTEQKLVDVGNELANAIDDVLHDTFGERGFILLIASKGPNQGPSSGLIFSNMEPGSIKDVMESLAKTPGIDPDTAPKH